MPEIGEVGVCRFVLWLWKTLACASHIIPRSRDDESAMYNLLFSTTCIRAACCFHFTPLYFYP